MARPNIFKRRYLVQKKFQSKFILPYILAASGVVCLSSWFLYLQIQTAVEKHLYRTHIKIDKVGDFLVELLFVSNFYSILAIVLTVLVVSLLVFKKLNHTFHKIDDSIVTMSSGDFNHPYSREHSFAEVGQLASLLVETCSVNQDRFGQILSAFDTLEQGATKPANTELLKQGKEQLDLVLNDISF